MALAHSFTFSSSAFLICIERLLISTSANRASSTVTDSMIHLVFFTAFHFSF